MGVDVAGADGDQDQSDSIVEGWESSFASLRADMSSIKALLKQAKECMASKAYRDALIHLKAALAEDKACYDAYVLVGKAAFFMREFSQVG